METGLFSGSSAPCPQACLVTSVPPGHTHAPAPSSVHTFSCQDPLPWRLQERKAPWRTSSAPIPNSQPNSRPVFAAGSLERVGWVQSPLLRSLSAVLPFLPVQLTARISKRPSLHVGADPSLCAPSAPPSGVTIGSSSKGAAPGVRV